MKGKTITLIIVLMLMLIFSSCQKKEDQQSVVYLVIEGWSNWIVPWVGWDGSYCYCGSEIVINSSGDEVVYTVAQGFQLYITARALGEVPTAVDYVTLTDYTQEVFVDGNLVGTRSEQWNSVIEVGGGYLISCYNLKWLADKIDANTTSTSSTAAMRVTFTGEDSSGKLITTNATFTIKIRGSGWSPYSCSKSGVK